MTVPPVRLPAVAGALFVFGAAAPAAALVDLAESRPGRPLVLADGETDLAGSLGLVLVTTPEAELADLALLPLRGAIGFGGRWEGALALDLAVRPSVALTLTPRARLRLDERGRLALGLAVTLPLGYLTSRLGPEGLPLAVELPVVRLESSQSALQAGLNLAYALREGPDAKALSLDAAGVVRVATDGFAVMDLGLALPELDPDGVTVALGLGLGWRLGPRLAAKLQVVTPDLVALDPWQLWITVATGLEIKAKTADDWL